MPHCSFQDARFPCISCGAVSVPNIQSGKISNTLLNRYNVIHSQYRSISHLFNTCYRVNMKGDSTRNCNANHKGENKLGKCISCGEFHSRTSDACRNAKCFKCGKIKHIKSVFKIEVHFATSNAKSCNLNIIDSGVTNDYIHLSAICKRLYVSLGSFHDYFLNTRSIQPIISFKN
ncbi:unnamed protein product [Schistosoma rodhaini]|uniref:Uncharacterized protein n=1 Tax=Schistosoma rodhaini TaxID=6188 RepID=A0AA85FKN3_9TREM|nr:unnamed protein product [Schistosoma rodhaini]